MTKTVEKYGPQNKNKAKMKRLGFNQPRYWVHDDDLDRVKKFCERLRTKKLTELNID